MPQMTEEQIDRIVDAWRTGSQPVGGWDSPAGPLFSGGDYAEADITFDSIFAATGCTGASCPPPPDSGHCGTACTFSAGRQCC